MNIISIHVPFEFIKQHTMLSWREAWFGIEHCLLKSNDIIQLANDLLNEQVSAEIIELAYRPKDQPVGDILGRLAKGDRFQDPLQIAAKWVYLILAWVYENRDQFADPLGVVEAIYSDFGYPEEMASFVRYMPTEEEDLGTLELNEARLFDKWKNYLDWAAEKFGRQELKGT